MPSPGKWLHLAFHWPYQWAGRCILNVKCINQSIATLSRKVPECAVFCNSSWSLLFISEYFHVCVERQLISLQQKQLIVMSSVLCVTPLLITKMNLQICVYVWQKTHGSVVITGIWSCRAVRVMSHTWLLCNKVVTQVVAWQWAGVSLVNETANIPALECTNWPTVLPENE